MGCRRFASPAATAARNPKMILLHRVAPEHHLYRWYSVHVQPTLLEPWTVVCAWGSLISDYRRQRAIPCESKEDADWLALQIIARKQKRGHKVHSPAAAPAASPFPAVLANILDILG